MKIDKNGHKYSRIYKNNIHVYTNIQNTQKYIQIYANIQEYKNPHK